MKHLLIDENLPTSLARILPVECSHATDLGQQPSNSLLWSHARERNWTILIYVDMDEDGRLVSMTIEHAKTSARIKELSFQEVAETSAA